MVEAARAARGQTVYEDPVTGHATRAHGPLGPFAFGLVQRLTGPDLIALRAFSLLAAALIGVVLIRTSGIHRRGWRYALLAAGLLLALAPRTHFYFVEHRPDLIALLFAVLACAVAFDADRSRPPTRWLLAALLVVASFGF